MLLKCRVRIYMLQSNDNIPHRVKEVSWRYLLLVVIVQVYVKLDLVSFNLNLLLLFYL